MRHHSRRAGSRRTPAAIALAPRPPTRTPRHGQESCRAGCCRSVPNPRPPGHESVASRRSSWLLLRTSSRRNNRRLHHVRGSEIEIDFWMRGKWELEKSCEKEMSADTEFKWLPTKRTCLLTGGRTRLLCPPLDNPADDTLRSFRVQACRFA